MKKSDWVVIALIVVIAGVASYFIANAILPTPNKDPQTVPTAESITANVVAPSDQIFNSKAINPTVKVMIGDQSNNPPFTLGSN